MADTLLLTDQELFDQFTDLTLSKDAFHHAQHVRVAWLFVQRYGIQQALQEFPAALRRFAIAKGAPTLYHETITWAYLLIINERQQRAPAADWSTFAATNADLLSWRPSILDAFYTPATLASELAKRTFVMPDRIGGSRDATPTNSSQTD